MKTQTATKDADTSKKVGKSSEKKDESTPKKEETPKVKAPTKKSVIIEMISRPQGALVNEMAEAIVSKGIDPDLEKNRRIVRLWLSKLGIPVKKDETGHYFKA